MNENLDLLEILKDCPKGTKLYSSMYGDVTFMKFLNGWIQIKLVNGTIVSYDYMGKVKGMPHAEAALCTLFPSKNQRDWFKFKPSIKRFDPKELKPFDKILIRHSNTSTWGAALFSHFETIEGKTYAYTIARNPWNQYIPYNDETKHLIGTTDDCPEYYKWWEVK